jgi:hypothetical protein
LADALRVGVSFLVAEVFLALGVRGPIGFLLADALRGVLFVVDGFLLAVGVVGVSSSSGPGSFVMFVCIALCLLQYQHKLNVNIPTEIKARFGWHKFNCGSDLLGQSMQACSQCRPLLLPQTQMPLRVAHEPCLYFCSSLHRSIDRSSALEWKDIHAQRNATQRNATQPQTTKRM